MDKERIVVETGYYKPETARDKVIEAFLKGEEVTAASPGEDLFFTQGDGTTRPAFKVPKRKYFVQIIHHN